MKTVAELKGISDTPIVIANDQGFMTHINECFTQVFGWELEDVVGQPLTKILPASFGDAHNLAFSRFQATGQSNVLNHPLRLKTVTKDNLEILTEHFIIAENLDGQWYFAAILRPLD